jgi:hypothetical protein
VGDDADHARRGEARDAAVSAVHRSAAAGLATSCQLEHRRLPRQAAGDDADRARRGEARDAVVNAVQLRAGARLAALFALAALGALGACSSVELAAPVVRGRVGPAAARQVRSIVALPASCGTLSMVRVPLEGSAATWVQQVACSDTALRAVDQTVRSNLELGGFSVIDSERVNAVTGSRREVQERRQYWGGVQSSTEIEQRGARFEDATPLEQRALLAELGAQGLLTTRVAVGASVGAGQRRVVTVQLQLLDVPERQLVWSRRCELEVGGIFATDEVAMTSAASCAAEGIRAR